MPVDSAALHQALLDHYDLEELRTLCFYLQVDYDILPGEGKAAKARELIGYMQRNDRLDDLVVAVIEQHESARALLMPTPASDQGILLSRDAPKQNGHNPFGDVGRITDPSRFYDRHELLRLVFEELGKGVNLSLVGESQIGKSSLLSMVCRMGPEQMGLPQNAFSYLNLEVVEDEDDFYAALCEALQIGDCRGYQLSRALRDTRHVLCLDEIEKMTWKGFTAHVRSQLRGLADGTQAPLKLVIASRSPLIRLFPDSMEQTSPLANVCRQYDVAPFPPEIARSFIAHRLRGTGVAFAEDEIGVLLQESGRHPARLQRAAAELYRRHRARKA